MTKLTPEERKQIAYAWADGESPKQLAERHGIHPAYVQTLAQRHGFRKRTKPPSARVNAIAFLLNYPDRLRARVADAIAELERMTDEEYEVRCEHALEKALKLARG